MKGVTLPNLHFTFCISHFDFFNDSLRVGKATQHIVPPSPSFQHFHQPTIALCLTARGSHLQFAFRLNQQPVSRDASAAGLEGWARNVSRNVPW